MKKAVFDFILLTEVKNFQKTLPSGFKNAALSFYGCLETTSALQKCLLFFPSLTVKPRALFYSSWPYGGSRVVLRQIFSAQSRLNERLWP